MLLRSPHDGIGRAFERVLIDDIRSMGRLADTGLLVIARHFGLTPEFENAAWTRLRAHRRARFGDALLAELLVRRVDFSSLPPELLAPFRPYKGLDPMEAQVLLETAANGSQLRLARILACAPKTVRRHLRAASSAGSTPSGCDATRGDDAKGHHLPNPSQVLQQGGTDETRSRITT
jgi:hypothetical protein